MQRMMTATLVAVLAGVMMSTDADARRLGSGGAGLRRPVPVQRAPDTPPPAQQAAPQQPTQAPNAQAVPGAQRTQPGAVPNAAAAPAPRRSWLGPIAGLAAGIGLAALFTHLGLGPAVGEFVMLLLLMLLGFVLVRWFLSRRAAAPTPAMAGAHAGSGPAPVATRFQPSPPAVPQAAAYGSPALSNAVAQGLDTSAVAEGARAIFLRLQQANDAGDLDTLRRYSTPEMADAAQRELQARGNAPQRTDVVRLDAELVDMAREDGQDIASVRFSGLLREVEGGVAEPFDELWHLVRPGSGNGEWRLAGIQPLA